MFASVFAGYGLPEAASLANLVLILSKLHALTSGICFPFPGACCPALVATADEVGFAPENQVRTGLTAGGSEIRTLGPPYSCPSRSIPVRPTGALEPFHSRLGRRPVSAYRLLGSTILQGGL